MQNNVCGWVISTGSSVIKEGSEMLVMSEESCVYADDSGLELGLGLSIGSSVKPPNVKLPERIGSWELYVTKLAANKEFDSEVSSSSSSSSVTITGTKRSAESLCSPPGRQVVGWPPIRSCRLNSSANHFKPCTTREFLSKTGAGAKISEHIGANRNHVSNENEPLKMSSFLKVTMDGIPIGRKVDLNAHTSYNTLAQSLDEMFSVRPSTGQNEEHAVLARQPLRLSDALSEYVLTYKDKDGDWMLVGDVPWDMFFNSVRRLRIMKRADANGSSDVD